MRKKMTTRIRVEVDEGEGVEFLFRCASRNDCDAYRLVSQSSQPYGDKIRFTRDALEEKLIRVDGYENEDGSPFAWPTDREAFIDAVFEELDEAIVITALTTLYRTRGIDVGKLKSTVA